MRILFDYIDESNCFFFYKLSLNHLNNKKITKWNELNELCFSTLKKLLISIKNEEIKKEECEFYDEIPMEILKEI